MSRSHSGTGLFWLFLFFWYFSGLPQILYGLSGAGELAALLDTLPLSLIWLVPVLLLPRYASIVCAVLGLLLWLASLVALAYFGIHGHPITQSVVFAMFESNPEETKEFFSQYFDLKLILGLALHALCAFLLWKRLRPVTLPRVQRGALIGLAVAIMLLYPARRLEALASWGILDGYRQYRHQLSQIRDLLENGAPPLQGLKDANGDIPRTLVLVIGESVTRRHMNLYGYPRPTSPRLQALRERSGQLSVFDDVIAPRPYTIEVLQQALTFANQEEPRRFPGEATLIDLMRQAGYKTIWITNQQTDDRVGLLSVFYRQADEVHALNQQFRKDANQTDEVLLEPFERALRDPAPKKMIVLHLLGAHLEYQHRYPVEFDRFKDRENTPSGLDAKQLAHYNAYDNAVLYNDSVLARMIEVFDASGAHGFLLHFSDHGEEVFDTPPHQTLGRNEDAPTPGMYTIPFFLWTSSSWQAAHPRDFSATTGRPYSTTHLIHTWSDLAGLSYDRYQPERSLVNPAFKPFTRWIGSPDGRLRDFDAAR